MLSADNLYPGSVFANVAVAGPILLVLYWPLLVATVGIIVYWRNIKHRGKFFFTSWIAAYGIQSLIFFPLPFILAAIGYDKQMASNTFVYFTPMLLSVLLSFLFIHRLAKVYWRRLYA